MLHRIWSRGNYVITDTRGTAQSATARWQTNMTRHAETVRDWIAKHRLLEPTSSVLVGLSGGLDSVVLADVLIRLDYGVHAFHANYGLRGEAADKDEEFVRAWCAERNVLLEVRRFDTFREAARAGESVQEAGRRLRYEAFRSAAARSEIPSVAVGHHLDDQVETVLINLFRGTGPEGLSGMPVARVLASHTDIRLVRPLLPLWKKELAEYAREAGLTWREDASNFFTNYMRGALRAKILPEIEAYFGEAVRANIDRSAQLMRAYLKDELSADIDAAFANAASIRDRQRSLDIQVLQSMTGVMRRRVILEGIRRWLPALGATSASAAEVESLIEAQVGRRIVHPAGEVWRERTCLLFRPFESDRRDVERVRGGATHSRLTPHVPVRTSVGVVSMKAHATPPDDLRSGSRNVEYVDADRIDGDLVVRPWRAGDRFVPLGMHEHKKVSDFLTDVKVPAHLKREVHVVTTGDEIVWVVGYRIADPMRVRPGTTRITELRFDPIENSSKKSA